MKTCVSINCPFILCCKDYNYEVNHCGGCKIQDNIEALAERLERKQKAAATI